MTIQVDIADRAKEIFDTTWSETAGQTVPTPTAVTLGNTTTMFDRATVLYADLDGSTDMVDRFSWYFAAEVYKAFLYAAARVITANEGTITAYDGDRVMGVFVGDNQTTNATRCALRINYAVKNIVQPTLNRRYPDVYTIKHKVGIDTSPLRAIKTGIRGDNDLTWVGRCANYAAKLTTVTADPETWLTKAAFAQCHASLKTWNNQALWREYSWTGMGGTPVYGSNWTWTL